MKGYVDDEMRALVSVKIGCRGEQPDAEILVWLDTAFNGSLVLPRSLTNDLALKVESTAEAILADGNQVVLETFGCAVQWLGKTYDTQIVTNESRYGLMGTALLADHKVIIDYKSKTVIIE